MGYRDETETLRAEVERLHGEVARAMRPRTRVARFAALSPMERFAGVMMVGGWPLGAACGAAALYVPAWAWLVVIVGGAAAWALALREVVR